MRLSFPKECPRPYRNIHLNLTQFFQTEGIQQLSDERKTIPLPSPGMKFCQFSLPPKKY